VMNRLKMQKIKEEKEKRKFAKDIERLDNLIKQNENEALMI
jgi:hypothetical protein